MAQKTRKYNKHTTLRKRQSKRNFRKKKSKRNVGKKQSKRNGRKTIKRGGAGAAAEDEMAKHTALVNSITINHPDSARVYAVPEAETETDMDNMIRSFQNCGVDVKKREDVDEIVDKLSRIALTPEWSGLGKLRDDDQDRATVAATVSKHGAALGHASDKWKGDRGVVLLAVNQNGMALAHAGMDTNGNDLKHDKQVVKAAVKQNGKALMYASANMKNDKEVVLAAVKHNGAALRVASADMKADHDVVRVAKPQRKQKNRMSPYY